MSVVVLGMHRSGTSLLVGLLEAHGFFLDNISTKVSPLKPTGTKENLEVRKINNKIFDLTNSSWKQPKAPTVIPSNIRKYICEVSQKFQGHKYWAIKDPRMIFTSFIWESFLPKHKYIGTFRNPMDVAISLNIKNKIPINDGLAIWYSYNLELVNIWKKQNFPIIHFGGEVNGYMNQFNKIANYLNFKFSLEKSKGFYQHRQKKNESTSLDFKYNLLYEELLTINKEYFFIL